MAGSGVQAEVAVHSSGERIGTSFASQVHSMEMAWPLASRRRISFCGIQLAGYWSVGPSGLPVRVQGTDPPLQVSGGDTGAQLLYC